ncbi:hypothetical protein HPB51_003012 [Rhipicephalus microplus]|uniref:DIX domain-containing protein n=1 Tax=Rhipicephalus microplus TaxID=6941 RepID=A0A9J6DT97_RHIMP|nr:hypothetical protein HPB51_003012 [Rhipicephalus microplus]
MFRRRLVTEFFRGPVPSRKVVPPDFPDVVEVRRRLEANHTIESSKWRQSKVAKNNGMSSFRGDPQGLVGGAGRQAAPGGEIITPHRFRSFISKKGNHRFFRRSCQEFGTDVVSEEMPDDNEVLSLGEQDPRHDETARGSVSQLSPRVVEMTAASHRCHQLLRVSLDHRRQQIVLVTCIRTDEKGSAGETAQNSKSKEFNTT